MDTVHIHIYYKRHNLAARPPLVPRGWLPHHGSGPLGDHPGVSMAPASALSLAIAVVRSSIQRASRVAESAQSETPTLTAVVQQHRTATAVQRGAVQQAWCSTVTHQIRDRLRGSAPPSDPANAAAAHATMQLSQRARAVTKDQKSQQHHSKDRIAPCVNLRDNI